MIQSGSTACASLAWMNTCGATTRTGTRIVTVILDVTPIRDRRGRSRLLDMVPGRSKRVFKIWLAAQPDTWRERIEIVAMDGFTGFKSAAAKELPEATAVMDPFHVVHLAGNALDECRQRIQQELHHRRGRAADPLVHGPQEACAPDLACSHRASSTNYSICLPSRSTSHSRSLEAPTRTSPGAYRAPDTSVGKAMMEAEMNTLTSTLIPRGMTELMTLGRTLKRRARDILAYIEPPPHLQWPNRSHQRTPRTPTRSRTRIPKPPQLHRPRPPRNRRIQTPTTPSIMKSPIRAQVCITKRTICL